MAEGAAKASTPNGEPGPTSEASTSGLQPAASTTGANAVAPSSTVDPLIGRVINGRFKITALIARGGMGRVYRAEQAPLGRVCALKILTTTYEGEHDPEFHKRFFLEASIASKITHPNSVTIFDYGQTEDDIYYMAMEFLEGVTLHRAIRTAGYFPEARVAHVGRQVCRALREAHALGCIHRDLKPANIFLTEHGDEPDFVKVLDFGLVKNVLGEGKPEDQLTQTGLFMGSPKYMAPEQIRGERVDIRTDVYSLGIIMYEMLTGKVPFERQTSLNTLMAQVNDKPPRLLETNPKIEVSADMEDLIVRCMAKNPADRVASMDEVLGILKRIQGPGMTVTGEYRALGASQSGPYSKAEPTPNPSRPPTSIPTQVSEVAASADGPSVSVSMSSMAMNRPSVTPMSAGSVSASGSVPPPDFRRSGGKAKYAIIGGAALALLAIVGLSLRTGSPPASTTTSVESTKPSTPTPPPTAAAPTPPPTAPAPPPAPTTLSVHFATEPAGASVKENNEELCAATPCDYRFAADTTTEHKIVVTRAGYRPETRVIHASDAQVSVTLAALAAVKPWTPPPQAPRPKPADSAAPQGFKDIPY
jgi:serine/threonine-protein kinase